MSTPPPLKVLYHLHPSLDTLDLTGPLEILSHAAYSSSSGHPSPIFTPTLTASTPIITSGQKLSINRDIDIETAYSTLESYDVLVIPGGSTGSVLADGWGGEPMSLIRRFCQIQPQITADGKKRERILFTVCTGSLFLARSEVLSPTFLSSNDMKGVKVTTHPSFYTQMRDILQEEASSIPVLEERFIVNRIDPITGLRVITAGGVSSGMDGALWLVEYFAGLQGGKEKGREEREKVEAGIQYKGRVSEGVVLR